uniref:VWFA domain-containing protein n=2 Tax=Steinernema glaseri TaxID=37863 RepID=A0A1I7YFA3_9BILA
MISGTSNAPRVVLVFKNGKASDDVTYTARSLREEVGAKLYVISVDDEKEENMNIVGADHPERVLSLDRWRGHDVESLGPVADRICVDIPQAAEKETDEDLTWPARPVTPFARPSTPRACSRIDYQADVVVLMDGSDNFDESQFDELKEGVSTLIDESFDLAPDVVQVAFVLYSDKVSVPVALGHYEDKLELLTEIGNSERLQGTPIVLKGLDAARQQFVMKGREGATRVLILITTGNNRGNAAIAAQELRERYNVELFTLAINPSNDDFSSLTRLVGAEFADQRLIKLQNVADLASSLNNVQKILCGYVTPAVGYIEKSKTTKRDVELKLTTQPSTRTTRAVDYAPLCKDGFRRAYLLNLVIDVSARSPIPDFHLVLNHITNYLLHRFDPSSHFMTINVIAVDSQAVQFKKANVKLDELEDVMDHVEQSEDERSPKLGLGIDEAVMLSDEHAIKGVNLVTVVVSADGTSRRR